MTCQGNTRILLLVEWCTRQSCEYFSVSMAVRGHTLYCLIQWSSKVMATVSMVKEGVATRWRN